MPHPSRGNKHAIPQKQIGAMTSLQIGSDTMADIVKKYQGSVSPSSGQKIVMNSHEYLDPHKTLGSPDIINSAGSITSSIKRKNNNLIISNPASFAHITDSPRHAMQPRLENPK